VVSDKPYHYEATNTLSNEFIVDLGIKGGWGAGPLQVCRHSGSHRVAVLNGHNSGTLLALGPVITSIG
jgi:hypothetical protein